MTAPARTRAAVLLATSALGAAVLTGCGSDDTSASDPGTASSATTATDPATPSDPATSAAPSTPASSDGSTGGATDGSSDGAGTVTVPVYFVGDTPQGPRLYREFRQVASADPLAEAAALLVAGDALDPDYRSLFPAGSLAGVSFDGTGADGSFSVTLPDDAWAARPADLSKAQARLAVQSLVYTLQGAAQARAPMTAYVGTTPSTLLGVATADGVKNAPELDVLAFVNVTSPEEGASVADTFTASGVASSFEGTVPWEVRDAAGTAVVTGFATAAGYLDKLYPWESEVDVSGLAPGTYTFAAMTDDPSGGEGGGPTEDTKTIVVE